MAHVPLTIEQIRDMINQGQASDPLVFLEALMNGQDLRRLSDIYTLIIEINDFCGGTPSEEDWTEVVDMAISKYKYHSVSLSDSSSAAKTLAEYLHPKRRSIEQTGSSGIGNGTLVPLTEEEIEMFREKFNEEF